MPPPSCLCGLVNPTVMLLLLLLLLLFGPHSSQSKHTAGANCAVAKRQHHQMEFPKRSKASPQPSRSQHKHLAGRTWLQGTRTPRVERWRGHSHVMRRIPSKHPLGWLERSRASNPHEQDPEKANWMSTGVAKHQKHQLGWLERSRASAHMSRGHSA